MTPRYSAPAHASLAPKRKQGHCARWRNLSSAWSRSSWLTSQEPREVCLALISPPLASQPGEAIPEEVLCRPPREAWPLARVLNALLMKMGRTGPRAEPRRGPQAGKSGDPRFQNADSSPRAQGALGLGFEVKPKVKRGAPRAPKACGLGRHVATDWTWASSLPHAASATTLLDGSLLHARKRSLLP